MDEPKYRSEYAKTGRSNCKGCKTKIGAGTLRLAIMVQSAFFDGKQPNWYHEKCFFTKQRPVSEGDFANFENLRIADQDRIKNSIAELGTSVSDTTATVKGKGKKRSAPSNNAILNDYGVEYAKSARATCAGCQIKIMKDEVRCRKTVYDTEVGAKFGGQAIWHHVECFAQLRAELGWFASGDKLPGYNTLTKEDQKMVKNALPPVDKSDIPEVKKLKSEPKDEKEIAADLKLEEKIAKQNKKMYRWHDQLKNVKSEHLVEMLKENGQFIPPGRNEMILHLADVITFGALKSCPKCNSPFIFKKSGYICTGYISKFAKCENFNADPKRTAFRIPKGISGMYPFIKGTFKVESRAVKYVPASVSSSSVVKKDVLEEGPRVKREKPPLYMMEFVIIGNLSENKDEMKKLIQKMGGKLATKIHEKLAAIISNKAEVEKMGARMKEAKRCDIQVVDENFLDKVSNGGAIEYIKNNNICNWGSDPMNRIPQEEARTEKSKSIYTKSVPKSKKLKLEDGTAVDPDSELVDRAHVFTEQNIKYFATLGRTDIQGDKNSYYKIQLLESNNCTRYWVFRSWGRIGTTIGGHRTTDFYDLEGAKYYFNQQYLEKTGNKFGSQVHEHVPGLYSPIDVDYGSKKSTVLTNECKIKSKLHTSVQELIKLLFDENLMIKTMMEFDLDMEKMPLGKLSQKQLQSAMIVLNDLNKLIQDGGSNAQFIDASNRFYTLVPHDFGLQRPPILDTLDVLKAKIDMIESLMQMEIAYNFLKDEGDTQTTNLIDTHYDQLKTDILPIDKNCEEFKILSKYVKNTHAKTHQSYNLKIEEVFKIARKGEAKRYRPFKKLHNRQLLWHGSRLTNFVGILSNGLKIAPPEAPATGYMFGKGIYFADMVSKSANYCCTSNENNTGLMLLSEVALGDMMECKTAKYITQLPKDKHSVKGLGSTYPDPADIHVRKDGVEIPYGKPKSDSQMTSLLYNEFIVYDITQVNIQYLLKMKFDYKN